MKYGIFFLIAAGLMAIRALLSGGWYLLLLWPAVSFMTVALGYLRFGPRVFGKRSDGTLAALNVIVLLPYLIYLWSVWYALRLVKREPAHNELTDGVIIGRRLLSFELPDEIATVVDLTCEFSEPRRLRSKSYLLFQVLDGFVPSVEQLLDWSRAINSAPPPVFIHCAEGHGRTGLMAALLLLIRGKATSAAEAVQLVQSKRPLVRLGKRQFQLLELAAERIKQTEFEVTTA